MATLTNDYNRCELYNVASAPTGRGPFFIRQLGTSPGNISISNDPYLLRKDGVWVLTLRVYTLSEAEQQQFMYDTAAEVMQVLDGLDGPPVIEDQLPEGITRQEILSKAETAISRLMSGMKQAKPCSMPG
jgi:hypothetical protein